MSFLLTPTLKLFLDFIGILLHIAADGVIDRINDKAHGAPLPKPYVLGKILWNHEPRHGIAPDDGFVQVFLGIRITYNAEFFRIVVAGNEDPGKRGLVLIVNHEGRVLDGVLFIYQPEEDGIEEGKKQENQGQREMAR